MTGKYGNGKSHTLKYARSLVRDREDVLVGYVAQPGEGFLDVYHEFMYDLGFDRVQELAYEFLAHVARKQTETNPMGAPSMKSLIDE
ncbi:ATPase, partial [Halorubrum sp. SP3]